MTVFSSQWEITYKNEVKKNVLGNGGKQTLQ